MAAIELTVLDFLTAKLDVPVFLMEPETEEETTNHLNRATFAIQSDGGPFRGGDAAGDGSLLAAMELNERVKSAMDALTELPEVSASRLNSDYPWNDEERKRCRYQAVYDVYHC